MEKKLNEVSNEELMSAIKIKKKKLYISNEELMSAIKNDKVLTTVMTIVCYTASKLANYIDKFEGIMTENDGDTACITIINSNYFDDAELFAFGGFKEDIIVACNSVYKPQYELIGIELIDDFTILKVKV